MVQRLSSSESNHLAQIFPSGNLLNLQDQLMRVTNQLDDILGDQDKARGYRLGYTLAALLPLVLIGWVWYLAQSAAPLDQVALQGMVIGLTVVGSLALFIPTLMRRRSFDRELESLEQRATQLALRCAGSMRTISEVPGLDSLAAEHRENLKETLNRAQDAIARGWIANRQAFAHYAIPRNVKVMPAVAA